MKQAIVAVEDRRFFEHRGVDLHGDRARRLGGRHDQQRRPGRIDDHAAVHQERLCRTDAPSISRKLKEAALAWQLEQKWSKDRILTAYLNTIYFGNGAYGIQQASETYFHHSAETLDLPEAALLAGIPQDPTLYDPVANPKEAAGRRGDVLRAMYEQGDITATSCTRRRARPRSRPAATSTCRGTQGPAQYFVNYVKQQLVDRCGSGQVFGGGLRVTTTIDLGLQQLARTAISKWLTHPGGPSAALVAIDPRNGEVKAMIGGTTSARASSTWPCRESASRARRSSRSSSRRRCEDGISPVNEFASKPVEIFAGDRVWVVHNYEGDYIGRANLQTATTYSDNSVYAQLTDLVGPASVGKTAHTLGITSPLKDYFSIGLGAQAVNPLEMARAYSTLANGGYRIDGAIIGNHARAIDLGRRQGANGAISAREQGGRRDRRSARRPAKVINYILQTVVTQGTGKRAQLADGAAGRGQDRDDRELRRRLVRRLHPDNSSTAVWVGYPNKLRPMLTRVQRRPGRRRDLSRVDLEGVHGAGAAPTSKDSPATSRRRRCTYSSALVRQPERTGSSWTTATAATRGSVVYFPGAGAAEKGELQAERGAGAERDRQADRAAKARLAAQPLKARDPVQAAHRAAAAGHRRRAVPEGRRRSRRTTR